MKKYKNILNKEILEVAKNEAEGWGGYREIENKYLLKEVFIESLQQRRNILFLDSSHRNYEMLQCSRGMTIKQEHKNIDNLAENIVSNELFLRESDLVRTTELEDFFGDGLLSMKSIAELGFRIPKLLNYYKEAGISNVVGYDVVNVNVLMGKHLGYDARNKDFNNVNEDYSDMSDYDLIISYHMFEHLSRPDMILKKIFDNMKLGGYMHVEVPIEPGNPRIRYGHLFPFHRHDLGYFLTDVGFKILHASNKTHSNGPDIERYIVQKNK